MKTSDKLSFILVLVGLVAIPCGRVAGQSEDDAIAITRSVIKSDRLSTVAEALHLTETESRLFWSSL